VVLRAAKSVEISTDENGEHDGATATANNGGFANGMVRSWFLFFAARLAFPLPVALLLLPLHGLLGFAPADHL
jgi:hypothetical protein